MQNCKSCAFFAIQCCRGTRRPCVLGNPDSENKFCMTDEMPETAKLIERINKDHMRELEEQLDLFEESRQLAAPFKKFADTMEFLLNRLKTGYAKSHVAAQDLQEALSTKTHSWNDATRQWDWLQCKGGAKLTDEETAQVQARIDAYRRVFTFSCIHDLEATMKTTLNKAQKTADIPHRVANHLQLTSKHDFNVCGVLSVFIPCERADATEKFANCMNTCDTMLGILWDKSLTLAVQHPSKRRRTE